LLSITNSEVVELRSDLRALTLELRALALERAQPRALIEQLLAPRHQLHLRDETVRMNLAVAPLRLLGELDPIGLIGDRPVESRELGAERRRPLLQRLALGLLEQARLADLRC